MRRILASIFVVVAGCGGATGQPAAPAASAPACAAVADAMVGMMMDGKDASQIADTVEAVKRIIRTRCTADAWTADARTCLAAMRTGADAERCSPLLTEAQQANLVADQQATFGDAPPAPGAGQPGDPRDGGE